MKTSYIYALEDQRTPNATRYIGRTNNPTKRLNEHRRSTGEGYYKANWVNSAKLAGSDINMEIIEEYPSDQVEDIMEAEEFYITYLKFLGAPLTNATTKSWGVTSHTPETLAKMAEFQSARDKSVNMKISRSLKGRPLAPEHAERLRARLNSPEWKAKMSLVHKGKKLSEEQKAGISKFHKGSTKSEETKQRISAALKGKPKTPEHMEKIAAFNRGKKLGPQTPEQIAARMAASRATRERKKQEAAALAVS